MWRVSIILLPAGSSVCRGIYWNEVRGAARWFTPPTENQHVECIFRARYILSAAVTMEIPSPQVTLPNRRDKKLILQKGPKRVSAESQEEIIASLSQRATIDYEEAHIVIPNEAKQAEQEESSDEENNSDDDSGGSDAEMDLDE